MLLSTTSTMCEGSMGAKKEGQPVPELNLVSLVKSGSPPSAHTYVPRCLLSWLKPFAVLPVKGRSVPCSRVTYLQQCTHQQLHD